MAALAAFARAQPRGAGDHPRWLAIGREFWLGRPNGREIEMIFKVVEGEDGALTTTWTSPTQGAAGIACTRLRWKARSFTSRAVRFPGGGGFDGELNDEGALTATSTRPARCRSRLDLKPAAETE